MNIRFVKDDYREAHGFVVRDNVNGTVDLVVFMPDPVRVKGAYPTQTRERGCYYPAGPTPAQAIALKKHEASQVPCLRRN